MAVSQLQPNQAITLRKEGTMFEEKEERRIGKERRCYSPIQHIPERRAGKDRRTFILVNTGPKTVKKTEKDVIHEPEIVIL